MRVEVVYATPVQQDRVTLDLPSGASAFAAILASGLLQRHAEIDLEHGKIGVFGKVVAPDMPLADGDRVEIYRPMAVDPKLARSARAGRR
jgi:putative ubiquitin-RnfH superfamily antitoxin RatB of RatAB toxin-antitoxin module